MKATGPKLLRYLISVVFIVNNIDNFQYNFMQLYNPNYGVVIWQWLHGMTILV